MKRKRGSRIQLVCGLLAVLMLCGAAGVSGAEIIHCDPNHGDHEFSGNTCTVCGWMRPGCRWPFEAVTKDIIPGQFRT